ncbi:MAG TPA: DedA family protein [Gemmatimonadales bacterium]|nr:DedA family protein [Gemmatimonadales bacterium]
MLDRIVTWLTETIFVLGYPGIIILMTIESSAFPFPSEVVMPPAGYLVAKGRMSFPLVMIAGIVGSLIGALVNYWLARWLDRVLRRYGKWILVSPKSLDKAETFFRNHGEIGTFIGRLVPVVRQLISIPAGMARMRIDRFVLYTSLGAGIWCLILTYIGYLLGQHEAILRNEDVQRYVGRVLVYLLPALALLGVVYTIWHRRRRRLAAPASLPPGDPPHSP